jgi:hypothetical protein
MPRGRKLLNPLLPQPGKHFLHGGCVIRKFTGLFLQRFVSTAQPRLAAGLSDGFNSAGKDSLFRCIAKSIYRKLQ